MTTPTFPSYAGHRFPAEVISHAVWLYFRFPLSLRMVEEMLAARGIIVSHKTIRQSALKFSHQNCWQETLGVARGGPGGHRARHPGAEPAGQTGRQTAPAQAAEAAMRGAARNDHRQAYQLWGCEKGDHAGRRVGAKIPLPGLGGRRRSD